MMGRLKLGFWAIGATVGSVFTGYVFVLMAMANSERRTYFDGARMPQMIQHVFLANGTHRTAALDLWMAGCRGREIAHAIYCEGVRNLRGQSIAGAVGLTLAAASAVTYGTLAGFVSHPLVPGVWIFLAAVVWLIVEAIRSLPITLMGGSLRSQIEPLVLHWKADDSVTAVTAHGGAMIQRYRGVLAAVLGCVVVLILCVALMPRGMIILLLRDQFLGVVWFYWLPTFAAAFFALRMRLRRETLRGKYQAALAAYLTEADAAYEHFVRTVLLSEDG